MNRLVPSLLIGFGITAFTALLLGNIGKFFDPNRTSERYEGEIVLKVDSVKGSPRNVLNETRDVLSRRLKYFGQKFTIAEKGSRQIRVTISGMFDSAGLRTMLVAPGEISIRGLYNVDELAEWKKKLEKALDQPVPNGVPVVRDTTASPEVQSMIDSIGESSRQKYSDLVEFPEPDLNEDDEWVPAAELLCIHSTSDSAMIGGILRSPGIEATLPSDAVLYYSGVTQTCELALYITKTQGRTRAPLSGEDIEEIYFDEFRILPAIVIKLSEAGRRKLERIAQTNTDLQSW